MLQRPLLPLLVLLVLVTPLLAAPLRAAGERLPVWRVQGGVGQAVLLGSIHLAYPSVYPLRSEIMAAFDAADSLVVEVDPGAASAAELQQLMLAKGAYPPGEDLQQHLSPRVYAQLEDYLEGRGLSLPMFAGLRPGLVVTLLTTSRMIELGMKPALGIDQYFLRLARGHKEILQLETAEQQIDLLLDFGDPDLLLEQSLLQLASIEQYLRPLYEAWLAGDAQRLEALLREDALARQAQFRPVYRRLFDDRNRAMAARILDHLATPRNYLVVVGAGHLVGEQGIIRLLQREGYRVEAF
jgi:uncharacterized protein YbaP (TraB family)